MRNIIEQFLILIQFTTRIPIFLNVKYSEEKLRRSIRLFPLVGLIIGGLLYLEGRFLLEITENRTVAGLLLN